MARTLARNAFSLVIEPVWKPLVDVEPLDCNVGVPDAIVGVSAGNADAGRIADVRMGRSSRDASATTAGASIPNKGIGGADK